jgi:hypothetical protein
MGCIFRWVHGLLPSRKRRFPRWGTLGTEILARGFLDDSAYISPYFMPQKPSTAERALQPGYGQTGMFDPNIRFSDPLMSLDTSEPAPFI